MFSNHFSSGWILLAPNLSLLKYFDITLPRHKSSKIESSGPPLMSHSIQFHCVFFHFSTVSKRETVYTRCHMKEVHAQSLSRVSNLIFRKNSQKFAKNNFQSYNTTANFSICKIPQVSSMKSTTKLSRFLIDNRRSTVILRRWIGIDRRYRPYSQVGESLSTVDIDRDRSTGSINWWIGIDIW